MYKHFIRPILFCFNPETAHNLTFLALKILRYIPFARTFIRLAYKKNGYVCVQSGAGIVADSVPEREYEECRNKADAVRKALETAEGGLE